MYAALVLGRFLGLGRRAERVDDENPWAGSSGSVACRTVLGAPASSGPPAADKGEGVDRLEPEFGERRDHLLFGGVGLFAGRGRCRAERRERRPRRAPPQPASTRRTRDAVAAPRRPPSCASSRGPADAPHPMRWKWSGPPSAHPTCRRWSRSDSRSSAMPRLGRARRPGRNRRPSPAPWCSDSSAADRMCSRGSRRMCVGARGASRESRSRARPRRPGRRISPCHDAAEQARGVPLRVESIRSVGRGHQSAGFVLIRKPMVPTSPAITYETYRCRRASAGHRGSLPPRRPMRRRSRGTWMKYASPRFSA